MKPNFWKTGSLTAVSILLGPGTALAAQAQPAPPFGWPFANPTYNVTAGFDLDRAVGPRADWTGWRSDEATAGSGHAYDNHSGHDFGMVTGTNLYAPAAGRVNSIRESVPNDDHNDTGNYLILDHRAATGTSVGGRDYRTRFWHLSQNGVVPSAVGAAVTKGSIIAQSDNTGNSTGPHLHYAVSLYTDDVQTCAFYHGWWETDEFYTAEGRPCIVYLDSGNDFLNVREGNTTSYNVITSLPPAARMVATQKNGWWRVMLPMPPAKVYETRTNTGVQAAGFTNAGTWVDWASKSSVADPLGDANRTVFSGIGSRASTFETIGDAADVATFAFTAPFQRGLYDIYTTWSSDANAAGVTYRVTHSGGVTDVPVSQRGFTAAAGNGTKASPYLIAKNPYVVNHTTVGAPDEWNLYSPQGTTLPQEGPENLYRFDLIKPGTVTITVDHTGYPTKDVDIQLLNAANPGACIQRADWTLTSGNLAAGTYYIACDSYGSGAAGNAAASPYKLTVEFSTDQPFPNSWVHLGQFTYTPGASGSVQIRENSVTGKVDAAAPGRVVADAIKIIPAITRRTGWVSNGIATRINTATTPIASVVIKTDSTANNNSNSMDAYAEVPIFESAGFATSNTSPIAGKAVTGQRFVCTARSGDWYEVYLSNGTTAGKGWILGDHLIGYHLDQTSVITDWTLY